MTKLTQTLIKHWIGNQDRFKKDLTALNSVRQNDTTYPYLSERYQGFCSDGTAKEYSKVKVISEEQSGIDFIVQEMSHGSLCALDMYQAYYKVHDETKLLSYTEIADSDVLTDIYQSNGADSGAFALATAAFWHLSDIDCNCL